MLNKFENTEADLPKESPKFIAMDAWAKANELYRSHFDEIAETSSQVAMNPGNLNDPEFNLAIELEASLQEQVPELIEELHSMQTAFDKMMGWYIKWRHWSRGEIIGTDETETEEMKWVNIVREPDQYYENEGTITGANIGVDPITVGLAAWIEIDSELTQGLTVCYNFAEMFAVELEQPS